MKGLERKFKSSKSPEEEKAARKEASGEALRDSEVRMRAILDTAVEGIITINERGLIELINPAAERIFGYKAGEVIGKNVSVLMPTPYRENHDSYLANYHQTGQAKIIGIGREVVGQRKNGAIFPLDLSISEVRLANRRLFTGFVRDITERKRLEKEILDVSEREQHRIGQDLHDGLGQHLTGIELMTQVLEQQLAKESKSGAEHAAEIARHVREAINQTRLLARGLSPVSLESEGLMFALKELSTSIEKLFKVECHFRCDAPVLIHDNTVATHLYRIAQEAVSNAIKHGRAKRLEIGLTSTEGRVNLAVRDNGTGFPIVPHQKGMGLRIMHYRAGMINGSLVVQKETGGGTAVVCSVHKN